MHRHALVLAPLVVALLVPSPRARAQATASPAAPARATIVRIDGEEILLDIGREGLAGERTLTVYRSVTVRHPLTRKALEDRFAIGELEIVQAGDALTLARAHGTPSHPFAVGDRVEGRALASAATAQIAPPPSVPAPPIAPNAAAAPARPAGAAAAAPAPGPTATATVTITNGARAAAAPTPAQTEAGELSRYYQATLGQPPERRIRVYQAYLERFPRSAYRGLLQQEIRYLQALQNQEANWARHAEETRRRALLSSAIELVPPDEAQPDRALALAARVRPEVDVRALVLHVRGPGEEVYRTLPLVLDERGHARVRIPKQLVRSPRIDFFIEAVSANGETASTFASAQAPQAIRVPSPPEPAGSRHEPVMRVRWNSELASFDGTSGRDYYLINEGDFFYRLHLGHLHGLRMGYGRFDGHGGTVEQLDELELEPRPSGFTYAFLEGDIAVTELVGVALRGTLGLGRPDPGEHGEIAGGFQARLRIGDPDRTNLVIAGELLPEIGQRALLHLGWELIERVPMAAEVQVTDQPVNTDELAVRIVYELGYRLTDRFALALRPSYQLRTIRHAGPGIGLSATFDW